jgi:RluA family pseudouridine synthase
MIYAKIPDPNLMPIIYQDDYLVAVNKPPGLVCHPVGYHQGDTLLTRLRYYFGPELRLVHRLDQQTSGVILAAMRPDVMRPLQHQFEQRRTQKIYLALVSGRMLPQEGEIKLPLWLDPIPGSLIQIKGKVVEEGQSAQTDYRVLAATDAVSLLEVNLHSGRKHQIRIHLAALGFPIIGDLIYRNGGLPFLWEHYCRRPSPWGNPLCGQGLHAHRLEIRHPVYAKTLSLVASLPQDWHKFMTQAGLSC